jgi:hypothetical protein
VLEIAPGKEEEFRHLRRWLASSEWLDRLVESTEPVPAAFSEALRAAGQAEMAEVVPVGAGRLSHSRNL